MSERDILVVAETERNSIGDMTFELLGAAEPLAEASGGQILAALLSADGGIQAARLTAADRILMVVDPLLEHYSPQPFLDTLAKIVRRETPRAVLLASSTTGLDLGPAIAARLGAPVIGNCRGIAFADGVLRATCSICAGKLLADVRIETRPVVVNVMPGAFHPTSRVGEEKTEVLAIDIEPGAIRFEEMIPPDSMDIDIGQEDVLVAVGRGIQQEDNMPVVHDLAEAIGGALCASRPIIDQGWLPTTRQVGKSGMIVKPRLYLALGISGAPEHVEGMGGADLTIAVNTDPEAPIFEVADYGVEMDLLELVPELMDVLKKRKVTR